MLDAHSAMRLRSHAASISLNDSVSQFTWACEWQLVVPPTPGALHMWQDHLVREVIDLK